MVSNTINNLIRDLKPRQREILTGRFGLEDGEKMTLAELGEKYGITRERTRQIEAEALRIIKEKAESELRGKILGVIIEHLEKMGGVRRDDFLISELKEIFRDNNIHHWHLRFISEVAGSPQYYLPDDDYHLFWYTDKKVIKLVDGFVKKLEKLIFNKKEELIIKGKFEDYFKQALAYHGLKDLVGLNYLSISRKFHTNVFGDIGLSHWGEINPKVMRDKAYLILKKDNKPLHFREITEKINEAGFGGSKALPQTIHNELIKDDRIVLVGRGIYALREKGFVPGTCQDVLKMVFKQNGPLTLKGVMDEIAKQRILKENTIILNLNNRKQFKKLADGRYYLA